MNTRTREHVTGLVLAGGRSSRFGADKSLHVIHGRTLREMAAGRLSEVCGDVLLSVASGSAEERHPPGGPFTGVVVDRYPGVGPLAGIHAGLLAMTTERLLVMPCDMPFVSADTVRRLAAISAVAAVSAVATVAAVASDEPPDVSRVAVRDGLPIGVLACYHRSVLGKLEECLRVGGEALRVVEFVRSLPNWVPVEIGEVEASNVNRPDDLPGA